MYLIRLNNKGYFGHRPFLPVEKEEAIQFPTMKEARSIRNRVSKLGFPLAEIVPKYEAQLPPKQPKSQRKPKKAPERVCPHF